MKVHCRVCSKRLVLRLGPNVHHLYAYQFYCTIKLQTAFVIHTSKQRQKHIIIKYQYTRQSDYQFMNIHCKQQ